jgi:hypothetical protein
MATCMPAAADPGGQRRKVLWNAKMQAGRSQHASEWARDADSFQYAVRDTCGLSWDKVEGGF